MPNPRPWFPFYVSDFWDDPFVRGLTDAQIVVYLRLLSDQWRDGFISSDIDANALRTHHERSTVEAVIGKFLPIGSDKLANTKLGVLRDRALNISNTNRLTAVRTHHERRTNAVQTHPYSESESDSNSFGTFWDLYPKRSGGNPRKAALKAYISRITSGVTREVLLEGVRRYAAFCERTGKTGTEFVKQAQFWLSPTFEGWLQPWENGGNGKAGHLDLSNISVSP